MWNVIWGVPMKIKVLTSSSSKLYLLTSCSSSRRLQWTKIYKWLRHLGEVYGAHINPMNYIWFCLIEGIYIHVLFNVRHYTCFYCKSNLRNGFLMPDFNEKVVLFVCICHLVQKLRKLLTFATRVWRNPRWPPNEPHGTLVHPVNINICFLDIIMSLKK